MNSRFDRGIAFFAVVFESFYRSRRVLNVDWIECFIAECDYKVVFACNIISWVIDNELALLDI